MAQDQNLRSPVENVKSPKINVSKSSGLKCQNPQIRNADMRPGWIWLKFRMKMPKISN